MYGKDINKGIVAAIIIGVVCHLCVLDILVSAESQDKEWLGEDTFLKELKADSEDDVVICKDDGLKVKFFCNPDWQMQPVENAILVVVSEEPDVTLILAKIDSNIKFLGQLTTAFLKDKNRYAPGFRTERITWRDREMIKVKAYAKDDAQKRLVDYYLVDDGVLYGILFSVRPKEHSEDYLFLFKKVVDSLEFIKT